MDWKRFPKYSKHFDTLQAEMDQTFELCDDLNGIADDIVIYGISEIENDNHMHMTITRWNTSGFYL